MKRTKIFVSALSLSLATLFYIAPVFDSNADVGTVFDKEAIDCGSWYGTKCVGEGDGCDPKDCDETMM